MQTTCPCCCNNTNNNNANTTQHGNTPSTAITRQRLSDDSIVLGLTTAFSIMAMVSWAAFTPGL
jgi:hypothetical protein